MTADELEAIRLGDTGGAWDAADDCPNTARDARALLVYVDELLGGLPRTAVAPVADTHTLVDLSGVTVGDFEGMQVPHAGDFIKQAEDPGWRRVLRVWWEPGYAGCLWARVVVGDAGPPGTRRVPW